MKRSPKPPAPPPKPPRPLRFRRKALPLIALLFVVSAGLRLGETDWRAFATTATESVGQKPAECPDDAGLTALLQELDAREKRVAQRELTQAERAKALEVAQKKIEERIAALKAAEEKLSQTLTIADTGAEEDVARLVTLYENMKPKEAAPLFEEMAPEFSAGFIARMRPDTAAALMAALDPKTAYSISVLLAGRNAGAPKP